MLTCLLFMSLFGCAHLTTLMEGRPEAKLISSEQFNKQNSGCVPVEEFTFVTRFKFGGAMPDVVLLDIQKRIAESGGNIGVIEDRFAEPFHPRVSRPIG